MRRPRTGPLGLPSRLAFLCGFPVFAVVLLLWSGAAAASDLHPVRHGEGRLWRIEHAGLPPSYIMGTVHVADPRVRDLPAPILDAFKNSEQAAFELRMTPEERQAMTTTTGPQRSQPLSKLVDKETYRRLVALGERYGLPEKVVDQLHPFMLVYIFSMPPEEHQRQASGDLFLDLWLIQYAYDLGLRVEELETLGEHLGVVDAMPKTDYAQMLRELVDKLEREPDRFERLVSDYLDGNMARTYREMEQAAVTDKSAKVFKEAFLDQRNRNMVERMIPLLERGRLFVAVGALHMPGETGMLHLLEQRGYRITRVY